MEKKISSMYFRYFISSSLGKGHGLHLSKFEFPSSKDALCSVALEMSTTTTMTIHSRLSIVVYFLIFSYRLIDVIWNIRFFCFLNIVYGSAQEFKDGNDKMLQKLNLCSELKDSVHGGCFRSRIPVSSSALSVLFEVSYYKSLLWICKRHWEPGSLMDNCSKLENARKLLLSEFLCERVF